MQAIPQIARALVQDLSALSHAAVVAIAGSVAAGKTTFANQLATWLHQVGVTCSVVTTDGFLLPNSVLESRGLLLRKGFPESYDAEAVIRFVEAVRSGASNEIIVPNYSHEQFDIVGTHIISRAQVIVCEGVNALQEPLCSLADRRIYLHADKSDLRSWFVTRLEGHVAQARLEPGGFYDRFVRLEPAALRGFANEVWDGINLPNLEQHIAPSSVRADWRVAFAADHSLTSCSLTT